MIKFERISKKNNYDQGFIILPSIIWTWQKPEKREIKTTYGILIGWLLWYIQIDNETKVKQDA